MLGKQLLLVSFLSITFGLRASGTALQNTTYTLTHTQLSHAPSTTCLWFLRPFLFCSFLRLLCSSPVVLTFSFVWLWLVKITCKAVIGLNVVHVHTLGHSAHFQFPWTFLVGTRLQQSVAQCDTVVVMLATIQRYGLIEWIHFSGRFQAQTRALP